MRHGCPGIKITFLNGRLFIMEEKLFMIMQKQENIHKVDFKIQE